MFSYLSRFVKDDFVITFRNDGFPSLNDDGGGVGVRIGSRGVKQLQHVVNGHRALVVVVHEDLDLHFEFAPTSFADLEIKTKIILSNITFWT